MTRKKGKFETDAIRAQHKRSAFREHSVPMYVTSSFVFDDAEQARALFADEEQGNIYTRFSNPNSNEFIEKLCLLEGAEDGFATASGMAAMYISMASVLQSGDHVLASRSVFGSTHQILNTLFPRVGISHTYADVSTPEKWEALIQPNTKMIFVETPSNPALDILDLEWLGLLFGGFQPYLGWWMCLSLGQKGPIAHLAMIGSPTCCQISITVGSPSPRPSLSFWRCSSGGGHPQICCS